MAAMDLDWIPQSLYCASLTTVAHHFAGWKYTISSLPLTLQFDVYNKLFEQSRLCQLGAELCNLVTFSRLLLVRNKRLALHQCFQAIRDHGVKISEILSESYSRRVDILLTNIKDKEECGRAVVLGFQLGGFLSDAGWNKDSATVFSSCFQLCYYLGDLCKAFSCCTKLLHVYNSNCMYKEAEEQFLKAQELYLRLHKLKPDLSINLASLFAEYGAYHFARSEYDKAYRWSIEALSMLKHPGVHSQTTAIDVLRLGSRACVVKRQFAAAERLVRHAVILSRDVFGTNHPKYSSTLLDYGFYLLNVDNVSQSQKAYQAALAIRQRAFGGQNLHVAVAHEDLAYASYVHQYSTGRFQDARTHADAAIHILSKILPPDHLLLASSNRVKALILEEIAIDSHNVEQQKLLLDEAHVLHLQSLQLARKAFGEKNVQTAKHYGNLGRLYQSMERYEKAEEMHLRAIAIKEELLGPNDYEVALSIGHIASLYNYDLKQYEKAEKLYLRSINIAKRLFGEGYSGLEYDYRGLIKIYARTGDFEKVIEYDQILTQWNLIREHRRTNARDDICDIVEKCSSIIQHDTESTETVIDDFFNKIQVETKSLAEQKLEEIFTSTSTRTRQDIAFGGPITSYSRNPVRGTDHRNVGDGTLSHSAVSVSDENQCSSKMDVDAMETIDNSATDDDITKALKIFNVTPQKKQRFLKVKKE
ncbi:amyloid protein-binding protein 2-like [Styela clava]